MTRLKVLLYIVAASQLALGGLTLVAPGAFFSWMGLTPPPPDNNYMLGMLAGRFLVFGMMFVWQAQKPEPSRFVIRAMVLIQAIDFLVGALYLGAGTITLATAAFPMFNAAVFGGLLLWWSRPEPQGMPERA